MKRRATANVSEETPTTEEKKEEKKEDKRRRRRIRGTRHRPTGHKISHMAAKPI